MLKVDPDQRFDIDQVCSLCETFQKHLANKPQIDTYLIMDDIIEKLSLLDYENQFCRGWKHKRISRIYWAHPPAAEEEKERIHMLYDMVYWLMSLNKEQVSANLFFLIFTTFQQGRKLGVFINYKDFKGKTEEALNKMVTDLKKFGLPNVKNIKIETLKPGYGEIACQLIDELVNIELYRREFEFNTPTFPTDDQSDQSGEEYGGETHNDDFQGKNEIINGIEINTHSVMSPLDNKHKRRDTISGKAEETKINFFDAKNQINTYDDDDAQPEEHKILETKIDPLEWNQEIDRVYRDLVKIEQEVEILRKQGGDNDYEEYLRHLELIIEMCNDIKQTSH